MARIGLGENFLNSSMQVRVLSAAPTFNNMKIKQNSRGFNFVNFTDANGEACSVQRSSSMNEPLIWLGVGDVKLKVLVRNEGWKTFSEEDLAEKFGTVMEPCPHVLMGGRMHLNRKQVKNLLPILKKFVETGEI